MSRRHKIEWTHILAILASFAAVIPQSRALVCYRCLPPNYMARRNDSDARYEQCSKFDGSEKFYKDCPTSTFCVKRIVHYKLPNGTMMATVERNCAAQTKVNSEYNFAEKKWVFEKTADPDAYSEGCFTGENRGTPNGPSHYCYCSSSYCNVSSPMVESRYLTSFLVILGLLHWNVLER